MAKGVIARLRIGTAAGVGVWLFTAIALAQAPDSGAGCQSGLWLLIGS